MHICVCLLLYVCVNVCVCDLLLTGQADAYRKQLEPVVQLSIGSRCHLCCRFDPDTIEAQWYFASPSTPLYHHNPWDLLYWQLDWIRLQQPVSLMLLNGHFHSHGPLSCHSSWCCRVRVWPAHLFVTAIGIRNRTQAVAWILPYGLYGQRE